MERCEWNSLILKESYLGLMSTRFQGESKGYTGERKLASVFFVSLLIAFIPVQGAPAEVRCGMQITTSIRLTGDLRCSGHGLIVATDGAVLDLNGHTIAGPGKGGWTWPEPNTESVGIWVQGRKGVIIKNGTVKDFSTPLLLEKVEGAKIEGVITSGGLYGIYLDSSRNVEVVDSQAIRNTYGIHLRSSHQNRFRKVSASTNYYNSPGGYGFYLSFSEGTVITESAIEGNANQGLWLSASKGSLIYRNNIIGNHPNAFDNTGENRWYDAKTKQGNYWGDYQGKDLDGDGVGDTPYLIGGLGEDRYPLMRRDGWKK